MLNDANLVILLDVDNTLFDNDRFASDLGAYLAQAFGTAQRDRYWAIYASLREQAGYADYLAALQGFRAGLDDAPALLQSSSFVLDYPFAGSLYPQALDVVAHLRTLGTTAVLSDGDIVFQPRKIMRSGIFDAVSGRVLIYVHKERMLDAMQLRHPARHYVMVDDKPQLLAAMKRVLGERLTTVFVRQGHYAAEANLAQITPAPDTTIAHIDELLAFNESTLVAGVGTYTARP